MFESVMWTYMKEEQLVLVNLLKHNNVKDVIAWIKPARAMYIVAHGSSYNAAITTAPFISGLTGIRVCVCTPSDFRNHTVSVTCEERKTTAILGISQTGTSQGVLKALEEAKRMGFTVLSITNETDSPIVQLSEATLHLNVGKEHSNAKTKGYSATLLVLLLIGIEAGRNETAPYYAELEEEISHLDTVRDDTVTWCIMHSYGRDMSSLFVIGSGMNTGSAMEAQLKVTETLCIPAVFSNIEEFSHGTHRAVNMHTNVLLINSDTDRVLSDKTVDYMKQKLIPVLEINAGEPKDDDCCINAGNYPLTQSILSVTAVIQAISAFVAEINGKDPNRDQNNDYTILAQTRVNEI